MEKGILNLTWHDFKCWTRTRYNCKTNKNKNKKSDKPGPEGEKSGGERAGGTPKKPATPNKKRSLPGSTYRQGIVNSILTNTLNKYGTEYRTTTK